MQFSQLKHITESETSKNIRPLTDFVLVILAQGAF